MVAMVTQTRTSAATIAQLRTSAATVTQTRTSLATVTGGAVSISGIIEDQAGSAILDQGLGLILDQSG